MNSNRRRVDLDGQAIDIRQGISQHILFKVLIMHLGFAFLLAEREGVSFDFILVIPRIQINPELVLGHAALDLWLACECWVALSGGLLVLVVQSAIIP